jgi:hypothetical protein
VFMGSNMRGQTRRGHQLTRPAWLVPGSRHGNDGYRVSGSLDCLPG